MPVYHYVSVDESGALKKGTLDCHSLQQAQQQLAQMQLTVIELAPIDRRWNPFHRLQAAAHSHVSLTSLSLFTWELGALLSAGIPVAHALKSISETGENREFARVISAVRTSVTEGHTLAYGMNQFPDVYPVIYRGTIAAGEKSGRLNDVITKLAHYLDQQVLIRQKIQQALIYPALLMTVSLIIIMWLLTHSIPSITRAFTENGQALPGVTVFLLALSGWLKTYGFSLVLAGVILYFVFRYFMKTDSFRLRIHRLILKMPVLSTSYMVVNSARFSATFGILFAAGLPVKEAMETACDMITLLPMKHAVQDAITNVTKGMSIHQALFHTGYFTPISLQLIAGGESSGKLDVMLEKSAAYQEQQVMRWITTALSLFEPVIILVMGAVVLFIVLAVLLPIFQMNEFLAA